MENAAAENVEDSVDRISNLPAGTSLYNILYFLSQKCVLSRSWRYLWTNRPTLRFSEIETNDKTRVFIPRVNKALQSRLDHNLVHLDEFHLVIYSIKSISLLKKWIPILTTIGVKGIYLTIFPAKNRKRYINLPSILFKSESLKRLYLNNCNLSRMIKNTPILFVGLKILRLCNVNFVDKDIFDEIISSCPLLTIVRLQECKGLKKIEFVKEKKVPEYLEIFTFINEHTYTRDECSIEISVPTLVTINIVGSKVWFRGNNNFGNLKYMCLFRAIFSSDSFDDCEFPRLQILNISFCSGWEQFDHKHLCINAPNLLFFQYMGLFIPSITFAATTSREWRSAITLWLFNNLDDDPSWFFRLSGLLQSLRRSKIFLSLGLNPMNILNINQQDIIINSGAGGNKPPVVVENLGLNMGHLSSFPSFLNALFSICRPMNIAQNSYIEGQHKELTEFLFKFLMKRDGGEFSMQEDLEELSIESFDTNREQWQPVFECAVQSTRIRFRLEWSEACGSSSKRRKLEI